MFDRGNFESYRQQLSLVDWDSLLVSDDMFDLFALLWSLFFRRITRLILLVNHGGLSFLTVIILLGMLVFAASIKARVMLLLDYRYHRLPPWYIIL
jgi:hypothetical protein